MEDRNEWVKTNTFFYIGIGNFNRFNFYGNSFLTDETGEVIARASRDRMEIIYAEYDFDEIRKNRLSWGLFRDRRPECYDSICH